MSIPEHILNAKCPHGELYIECGDAGCNDYLRDVEEGVIAHPQSVEEDPQFDNSAEAWEEDWDDSPQLGGMGEELRQEYGE